MPERPTRPVELQRRRADSPEPALELVDQRRIDGPDAGPQQPRTVVVVSTDDGPQQVDVPQDSVAEPDGRDAELIETVLAPKVGGDA